MDPEIRRQLRILVAERDAALAAARVSQNEVQNLTVELRAANAELAALRAEVDAAASDGAARAVCLAIEAHCAKGGSIPWPSIRSPFATWQTQAREARQPERTQAGLSTATEEDRRIGYRLTGHGNEDLRRIARLSAAGVPNETPAGTGG